MSLVNCPVKSFCANNHECNGYCKFIDCVYECDNFVSIKCSLCKDCKYLAEPDTCYECEPWDNLMCLYKP